MFKKNVILTVPHAIVIVDCYNKLIANKQYKFSPAHEFLANEGVDYAVTMLTEFNSDDNTCMKLGENLLLLLNGKLGRIALYKHGIRRKVTIVGPQSFWDAVGEELNDEKLIKWLINHHYLSTQGVVTDFNLDRSTPLLNW